PIRRWSCGPTRSASTAIAEPRPPTASSTLLLEGAEPLRSRRDLKARGVLQVLRSILAAAACAALCISAAAAAQPVIGPTPPMTPDITGKFVRPTASFDYVKREVM